MKHDGLYRCCVGSTLQVQLCEVLLQKVYGDGYVMIQVITEKLQHVLKQLFDYYEDMHLIDMEFGNSGGIIVDNNFESSGKLEHDHAKYMEDMQNAGNKSELD